MFTFETKAKSFKSVLDIVSIITDEAVFLVSKEGLKLRVLDATKQCFLEVSCNPLFFSSINVGSESEMLTLSIAEIGKLLKSIGSNDNLSVSMEDNTLKLTLKGKYLKNFNIVLKTKGSYDDPGNVKLSPDVKVKAVIVDFASALSDAAIFNKDVKLKAKDGFFTIFTKGDKGGYSASSNSDLGGILSVDAKEEFSNCYSVAYLTNIMDTCKYVFDVVVLEYGKNCQPLQMSFTLPELSARFWLTALKD